MSAPGIASCKEYTENKLHTSLSFSWAVLALLGPVPTKYYLQLNTPATFFISVSHNH